MSNPKMELFAALLDWAREETLKAAASVPEDRRLSQLCAGKATPLWLLGHLASAVNTIVLRWLLEQEGLVSKEMTRLFSPDFAGGTPPSTDASMYPAWEEVVGVYDAVMKAAVEGIKALPDSDLDEALKGRMLDAMRTFFPTARVALTRMVNHDAYHRGQIGIISKLT